MEAPRWREFLEGRLPTGPINNGIIPIAYAAETVKTAAGDGITPGESVRRLRTMQRNAAGVVNAVVELAAIRVWKKL